MLFSGGRALYAYEAEELSDLGSSIPSVEAATQAALQRTRAAMQASSEVKAARAKAMVRGEGAPAAAGGSSRAEKAAAVAQKFGIHHDAVEMAAEFVARGVPQGARLVAAAVQAERRGRQAQAQALYRKAEILAGAVEEGTRMGAHPDLLGYVGLFLAAGDNQGLNALTSVLNMARTGNVAAARRKWPAIEKRARVLAVKYQRAAPRR